jgi:hypothetical protein
MTTIAQVASEGDELKTLIELRNSTAVRMELAQSDQNYVMLGRLLSDTIEKIKKLESAAKGARGTALDELAKRRTAAGRPDSSTSVGATRKAK